MRICLPVLLLICICSCNEANDQEDLCDRYFEPYPDLISGREKVHAQHQIYSNGMRLYADGEFEQAADSLKIYIGRKGYQKAAHLYLAMCYLELDLPFDAELQLDHLENSREKGFSDQTEWYTLLAWVCSGQYSRALPEAERIAALPRHTYRRQAAELARDIERMGNDGTA